MENSLKNFYRQTNFFYSFLDIAPSKGVQYREEIRKVFCTVKKSLIFYIGNIFQWVSYGKYHVKIFCLDITFDRYFIWRVRYKRLQFSKKIVLLFSIQRINVKSLLYSHHIFARPSVWIKCFLGFLYTVEQKSSCQKKTLSRFSKHKRPYKGLIKT